VQLEQVLLNLLTNAIQASPDHLTIEVVCDKRDDKCVVSVRDHGPGIVPAHLSKLFDPFFTTKPVGQGTGLGLSICHSIVAAHHGRITADNAEGGGAIFRVELPALPSDGA